MFSAKKKLTGLVAAALMLVSTPAWATEVSQGDRIETRIYNGNVVSAPNPYPWMTALLSSAQSNPYLAQFCGGSLITDDLVVTAAHCVDGASASQVQVAVGFLNLSDIAPADRQTVSRIIIHPDWDDSTTDSDIALLVLSDGTRNSSVEKIPLISASKALVAGDAARAIGWGKIETGGYPDSLRYGDMEITASDGASCPPWVSAWINPDTMVCALGITGDNKLIDACFGDSGGPLLVQDGATWVLAGATSWGSSSCGADDIPYPGVWARISGFLDWIDSYINPEPILNTFTPTSGSPGITVSIRGENLDLVTDVEFNGVSASFTISSSTLILATVPTTTSGVITLTYADGSTSSARNFNVTFSRPSISRVAPTAASAGDLVTITGRNFLGTTSVKLSGVEAEFTVISSTSLRFEVPNGATTGRIQISNPMYSVTYTRDLRVLPPPGWPQVNRVNPATLRWNRQATITGLNFTGATAVYFNGVAASSFTVVSNTEIRAIVPSGATAGRVSVTNGLGTTASDFTVRVRR